MSLFAFFYSPFPSFYSQLTQYYMPKVCAIEPPLITMEKSSKQISIKNCQNENLEKLQLTETDLRNQTYQVNKKSWDQEEDKKLLYLYEKKKLSWQELAKKIPGRNKKMCYNRYRRLQSGTKVHWTKNDDHQLINLVNTLGQNWKQIAKHFSNRNPKQIKEHYQNYARLGIDKSEWCLEDDLKLIKLINQHGKNWKIIEEEMNNRSLNQIKNRFFGKLKKLNALLYNKNQS